MCYVLRNVCAPWEVGLIRSGALIQLNLPIWYRCRSAVLSLLRGHPAGQTPRPHRPRHSRPLHLRVQVWGGKYCAQLLLSQCWSRHLHWHWRLRHQPPDYGDDGRRRGGGVRGVEHSRQSQRDLQRHPADKEVCQTPGLQGRGHLILIRNLIKKNLVYRNGRDDLSYWIKTETRPS